MTEFSHAELEDRAAREEALDTSRSILVQAPAGSGKTELLTMRFLKLLAEVREPDEILAITFTRPATAEMRHRILGKLEEARLFLERGVLPDGADFASLQIATAALENSTRRNWRLLDRPQALNIQTIDSLCLRILRQLPVSAGPGAQAAPTESAKPLYRMAARKTFDCLGGEDAELNAALRAVLLLRDSKLAACEALLAEMLGSRDQWIRAFPLEGEIDWPQARARLEEPFQREIHRVLNEAHSLLSSHPALVQELLELANYACNGAALTVEIRLLAGMTALPSALPEFVDHWRCLCNLLLTAAHGARKTYNVGLGFPPKGKEQRGRMKRLAEGLAAIPGLLGLLRDIRELPPPRYSEEQWQNLRDIFTALRQAVRELNLVFAEQNSVDFVELSIAALKVLTGGAADRATVGGVRHLLVDEFQDTSRSQHQLIAAVLRDWPTDHDGEERRTFFLVGDPMQSIYMFRQADVELFDLVARRGFASGDRQLPAKTLRLTTNFRSNAGVVKPLNALFKTIFPYRVRKPTPEIHFLPGVPDNREEPDGAFRIHAYFLAPKNSQNGRPASKPGLPEDPQRRETEEIVEIIRTHLPRIEKARVNGEEFTVAVLARVKAHLTQIATSLRLLGIPFRAVELETLRERQEILDLQSLTRALLHPMDRIAWLSVLRAPWCGLALSDLHLLCGTDDRRLATGSVSRQIEQRLHLLSGEARARVERVSSILQTALRNRHLQFSFSSWIERSWHSLGGPGCVDEAGYENAQAYFRMLEEISLDGIAAAGAALEDRLQGLFATPDPAVDERCGVQLMTMHKAKGLGFNVVLLPGLDRVTRADSHALIRYLERASGAGTEILAAPIGSAADEKSPLHEWIKSQRNARETEERKRLLYVACTRAREELHLFATMTVTNSGLRPQSGSLLHSAWPALGEIYSAKYAEQIVAEPERHAGEVIDFPPSPLFDQPRGEVVDRIAAAIGRSMIQRLPLNWSAPPVAENVTPAATNRAGAAENAAPPRRPQGSRASRTLGTTVHTLLEQAARLLARGTPEGKLRADLSSFRDHAATLARNDGLPSAEAESIARRAVAALDAALADPHGLWILKARERAQAESSWTGVVAGASRTIRVDRSFYAGAEPLGEGDGCLWIIDYKTATHGASGRKEFLESERLQYSRQLERYAEMLRLAHGGDLQLRVGLYYPLLPELVWWPA